MRRAFVETLVALADRDPRIVLLTGDLGYTVLEPFADKHPDRFFNVGVAEQNMIGLATGLAEGGFVPFVYSIATFATLRGYEAIRNGPVAHRSMVRIVGIGGGVAYGSAGFTHHALEDLGVMRMLRGMSVVAPADAPQASNALLASWEWPGPVYYRLGKDDDCVLRALDGEFIAGQPQSLRGGSDLLFISTGAITSEVAAAASRLVTGGVDAAHSLLATLEPVDPRSLAEHLRGYELIVSVEAHDIEGGLGSLVATTIAEYGLPCRLVRCGVESPPDGISGSEGYLQARHGISQEALVKRALEALGREVGSP